MRVEALGGGMFMVQSDRPEGLAHMVDGDPHNYGRLEPVEEWVCGCRWSTAGDFGAPGTNRMCSHVRAAHRHAVGSATSVSVNGHSGNVAATTANGTTTSLPNECTTISATTTDLKSPNGTDKAPTQRTTEQEHDGNKRANHTDTQHPDGPDRVDAKRAPRLLDWTVVGMVPLPMHEGDSSWRTDRPRPLRPGLYITLAAEEVLQDASCSVHELVERHKTCRWGQVSWPEAKRNGWAMANGRGRIFSRHRLTTGEYVWIRSEGYATRRTTIVLTKADWVYRHLMYPPVRRLPRHDR